MEPGSQRGDGATAWRRALATGNAAALAAALLRVSGRLPGRVPAWIRQEADARRPALWLPVAALAGALAYFAADVEPAAWSGPAGFVAGVALVVVGRGGWAAAPALVAAAFFAGFTLASLRTVLVGAPVLGQQHAGVLQGFVETLDVRPAGVRLLVRVTALEGIPDPARPVRVRVTLAGPHAVRPGDHIAARARLLPPPEASRPGGYSFAREAYFQRIGAIGSLSGPVALAPPPGPVPWDVAAGAAVDRARNALTARIIAVIGGAPGAVAASLVTGKRGQIPEPVNDDLRAAGIYHVVSISGLHMVLAAGMAFWLVRAALALVPALALRLDIRRVAAAAAMVAGAAYNVFAGAEIATQRSLLMTLVLFGAMLVDRAALSMRNLAVAALFVVALEPESVMGPSFQMSFAAVAALIALYERPGARAGDPEAGPFSVLAPGRAAVPEAPAPWPWRLGRWALTAAGVAVLTTLAAEAATGPFSLYHFQRIAPYGVIGNALTLPLVSFVVMPMALLGVVAWPFGLDAPAWTVMGYGIEAMLRLSALVAAWSGSTAGMAAFGQGAFLLLVAGLLWCVLWISPLRWLGLIPAALGIVVALRTPPPDVVVTSDGRSAAVRGADGRLGLLGRGPGSFVVEQWLRADGDLRTAVEAGAAPKNRCDPLGCVARLPDGAAVALVLAPAAFETDCPRAAVVVSALAAPAWCKPRLLLDRPRLSASGAVSVVWRADAFRVAGDRTPQTLRPWIRVPALQPTQGGATEDDEEGGAR